MPLIKGFTSTSIWKAFILNSLASTLVILIAVTVKERYDTFTDNKNNKISRSTSTKSLVLTVIATFFATLFAYTVMYLIFGYGGGMLTGV